MQVINLRSNGASYGHLPSTLHKVTCFSLQPLLQMCLQTAPNEFCRHYLATQLGHHYYYSIECQKSTNEKLFAELLLERVGEELREAGEDLNRIDSETAMVAKLRQHRPHGLVHHLHVDLET